MTKLKILHNPRCSKSREALQLLRDMGSDPEIVEYLKAPLSEAEYLVLLDQLGNEPLSLIRQKEPVWQEMASHPESREGVAATLAENPGLMERPVVIAGERALIARPPGLLKDWL